MKKLHLGCGPNRLDGWENYDIEMDLRKPLPFDDCSVDMIFTEHVIEHLDTRDGVRFILDGFRVLKQGGVMRTTFPCLPRIMEIKKKDPQSFLDYENNVLSKGGVMRSTFPLLPKELNLDSSFESYEHLIGLRMSGYSEETSKADILTHTIFMYEHKSLWTVELMAAVKTCAGFSTVERREIGDLESHGRIIGEKANWVESECVEAIK